MQIKVYSNFEDVKQEWLKFTETGDYHGFQCYQWLDCWHRTIGITLDIKPCFVFVCSEDQSPLLFLPLMIKRVRFLKCLTWLGDDIADYQAPILSHNFSKHVTEEDFFELWKNILTELPEFDVIHFKQLPEKIANQFNPFVLLNVVTLPAKAYSALLGGKWDDFYVNQVKKRIRADSNRQKKRLAKLGELRFIIAESSSEINLITNAMISQKERRYRETQVQNPLQVPARRQFYHECSQALVPQGIVHVSALLLADKIIATHWSMIAGKHFYCLMPTYEGGEWKKYSAGRLLLENLMEWACDHGFRIFDFTGGDEPYKKDWCNHEIKLYEYCTFRTTGGFLYYLVFLMKGKMRKYPVIFHLLHRVYHSAKKRSN